MTAKSADHVTVMKINSNTLKKFLIFTVCLMYASPFAWSQSGRDGVRAGSIVFAS